MDTMSSDLDLAIKLYEENALPLEKAAELAGKSIESL